jgi:hypothetical protein
MCDRSASTASKCRDDAFARKREDLVSSRKSVQECF